MLKDAATVSTTSKSRWTSDKNRAKRTRATRKIINKGILEWVGASDVMTSLSRHSHLPLFKYHSGERAWAVHKI
jgi:hypothetical protein